MKLGHTELPGIFVLEPEVYADERGYFMETMRSSELADFHIPRPFVQENQSGSVRGTLRGLHFQLRTPQAKLCRVISGEVLDVAVDIRHNSPTFGRHVAVVLSAENRRQLYVPRNFAHGYAVLSEFAEFLYKCDDYYDPDDQCGVAWDDANLGIDWRLTTNLILSEKDRLNPVLNSLGAEELPVYSG